jgi:hypothetical protein
MNLAGRQLEFAGALMVFVPIISSAAITGNATEENKCYPVTVGVKDHGSDGALQWRLSRLVELKSWKAWNMLATQAAFAIFECRRDYPSLYRDLMAGTKSLKTLTANFMEQFEIPAVKTEQLDLRIQYAEDVMKLLTPSRIM